MEKRRVVCSRIWLLAGIVVTAVSAASAARADELAQILRGYEIAPVQLNLARKDWALVGLGSYLVNTTGCNDCHTHPNYADGHNPYLGQPEMLNTTEYLAGGRVFGPVTAPIAVSANITPDQNGRSAGLTLAGFLEVMHRAMTPEMPRASFCRSCRGRFIAGKPTGSSARCMNTCGRSRRS